MKYVYVVCLRGWEAESYARELSSWTTADSPRPPLVRQLNRETQMHGLRGAEVHVLRSARFLPELRHILYRARVNNCRIIPVGWLEPVYVGMPKAQRGGVL